jgi:Flp pilus assembly protein TadG
MYKNKLDNRADDPTRGLLRRARVWRERHGNVAVLSAMLMPLFMGAIGLGVEASNWSVMETELQRNADLSAFAAAVAYLATSSAHTAANAAADVAELNGMPSGERSWTSTTKTLTDGLVTVQQISGLRNANDVAFLVTMQKPVSLTFAKLFVSATSYNIPAASTVELIPTVTAQPCVLGLAGYKTGVTSITAVNNSGSMTVNATGCAIRSNGIINVSGGASITANGLYAGGAITTSNNSQVHSAKYPNDGQIPDPYASYTPLQTALALLGPCSACSDVKVSGGNTQTIGPGTYSSIQVSGNLTLQPGLYVVDGDVTVTGSGGITALGATIVTNGNVSLSGSQLTTLTAPGTNPVGGAVPGIALAGTTTSNTSMTGSSNLVINGVVYFPNSSINFSGSWGNPNSPCLELIGYAVTLAGNSSLGGTCSYYGAKSFSAVNTSTAALVQ